MFTIIFIYIFAFIFGQLPFEILKNTNKSNEEKKINEEVPLFQIKAQRVFRTGEARKFLFANVPNLTHLVSYRT